MITVPDEIKNLYHEDHRYKNIRIHFPNGERTDICNDLIVKDSVSFTESLCSQNTLKFGLCESPIFECDTVGVGNIKGATIEVSIEIECPYFTPGAEFKTDIRRHIYSIPYGTFVVDSCKRQADMNHRKIVAYGEISLKKINTYPNPVSRFIVSTPTLNTADYTPDLVKLIVANLENSQDSGMVEIDTRYNCYTRLIVAERFYSKTRNYGGYPRYCIDIYPDYIDDFSFGTGSRDIDFNTLCYIPNNGTINPDVYDEIKSLFEQYSGGYLCPANSNGYQDISENQFSAESIFNYLDIGVCRTYMKIKGQSQKGLVYLQTNSRWLYPLGLDAETDFRRPYGANIRFHVSELDNYGRTTDIYDKTMPFKNNSASVQMIGYTYSGITLTKTFARMQQDGGYVPNMEEFEPYEFLNSFLETQGLFGQYDRNGDFVTKNIQQAFRLTPETALYPGDSIYPQGVTGGKLQPKDYQSCWYDDEYTKPFGAIQCAYKDTNSTDCVFFYYLNGYDETTNSSTYQIYDISNNSIIKNEKWTQAQIQTFCEVIANNVEGVTYMPVDFKGRGLPYVESGDTFEILTRSNDSITTIVLNHNIVGEQTLTDTYKSV